MRYSYDANDPTKIGLKYIFSLFLGHKNLSVWDTVICQIKLHKNLPDVKVSQFRWKEKVPLSIMTNPKSLTIHFKILIGDMEM